MQRTVTLILRLNNWTNLIADFGLSISDLLLKGIMKMKTNHCSSKRPRLDTTRTSEDACVSNRNAKLFFLMMLLLLTAHISPLTAQLEVRKYMKFSDSNATPTVPASGDLHLIPKGASGLFLQYPNGNLRNLDSIAAGLIASDSVSMRNYSNALYLPIGRRATFSKSGSSVFNDSIRFIQGSNVTLTQSGNTIEIAATGGGGVNDTDKIAWTHRANIFTANQEIFTSGSSALNVCV